METSTPCTEELTLELGGELEKSIVIIATDACFGYPVIPQAKDLSVLVFPKAEMETICEGVTTALQKYDDYTKVGVLIVAGSNNFSMENQFIGGKVPISYLTRNWTQVSRRISDSITVPLRRLNRFIDSKGARLQVATVLPSPDVIQTEVPLYAELLREALKNTNTWIRQLNSTNHQPQLLLTEQYFNMQNPARRSQFLAVYRNQNYRSLWRTVIKAQKRFADSL